MTDLARQTPARPLSLAPKILDVPARDIIRQRHIQLLPLLSELYILTKDLGVVRLGEIMNHAQRDFVRRCEHQLATKGRIRMVVLKARQVGISTVIEGICFVLSMMFDNLSSMILSHETESSKAILGMTHRYWNTFVFREFYDTVASSKTSLEWTQGSNITIATAKNMGAGRSRTLQFLHGSEVASYPNADQMMGGLMNSVPQFGLSAVFLESTAKGVGNFFHRQCNLAMRGDSDYEFVFYPWFWHPEYTAAYLPSSEHAKYQPLHLDEEERKLVAEYNVTDSQLLWRRWAIVNNCQNDVTMFHQEYPSSPWEAFVSTGNNVFPLQRLEQHVQLKVGKVGELRWKSGRVEFVENREGPLTIFVWPSDDTSWGQYILGADPTHSTAGDWSCGQVINRRTLEQVAVYRKKQDPVSFAKDLQKLGRFYNDALIAPEQTGPGGFTCGALANDGYPNLYRMVNIVATQGTPANTWGWHTNQATKHIAIQQTRAHLMDEIGSYGGQAYGLMIHDIKTFEEMRDYVTSKDGQTYTNGDGSQFDDGVMALAIALAVNYIEPDPDPYQHADPMTRPVRFKAVRALEKDRDREPYAIERPASRETPTPVQDVALEHTYPKHIEEEEDDMGADDRRLMPWEIGAWGDTR